MRVCITVKVCKTDFEGWQDKDGSSFYLWGQWGVWASQVGSQGLFVCCFFLHAACNVLGCHGRENYFMALNVSIKFNE